MNTRFAQAAVLVASMLAALTAWAAPTVTMWKSGEKEFFHPGTNYINQSVTVTYAATAAGIGLSCSTNASSGYGAVYTGARRVDTFDSTTAQTKTYEVTCTDSTGSTTKSVSVTWSALPAAPTVSATVTPTTYYFDEDTTYAWTVSNAYSCKMGSFHRNDDDTGWVRHRTETFFPAVDTHLSGSGVIADKSWFMPNGNNKYRYKLDCTNAGGTTTVNKDVTYANRPNKPVVKLELSDPTSGYISTGIFSNVGLNLTVSSADSCWTTPGDFVNDSNAQVSLPASGTVWIRTPPAGVEDDWKTYAVACKNNTSGLTTTASTKVFWRANSGTPNLLDGDRDTGFGAFRFAPRLLGGLTGGILTGGTFGGVTIPSNITGKMCDWGQALIADGTCAQKLRYFETAELRFVLLGVPSGTVCTRTSSHPPTGGSWTNTNYTTATADASVNFTVEDDTAENADTSTYEAGKGIVYTNHWYTLTCNGVSKTIPIVFN